MASCQTAHPWLDERVEASQPLAWADVGGDWSAKSGYLAALELIRHHRGNFTALVSANDHMALGALSAFHENGIEVPDEISVIGYDGMPESEFYQPSLTTIYQDFAALGEMSVEFLLRLINQPGTSPPRFILRPVLIPRKSTAPQNEAARKSSSCSSSSSSSKGRSEAEEMREANYEYGALLGEDRILESSTRGRGRARRR